MLIERDGDTIILQAPLVSAARAKEIPGARHDVKARVWRYPLSWGMCVMLRGVFGDGLAVGPELAKWAHNELWVRISPAMLAQQQAHDNGGPGGREATNNGLREAGTGDPSGEAFREELVRRDPAPATLYRFQEAGVEFLDSAGSALVADEMGLGKTVQTIFTLERGNSYPALVVAPNSVKNVWAREFAKWAPQRLVRVASSGTVAAAREITEVANGQGDVLVVNWEALKNLSRLAGFGSIRLETCSNCDPTSTRKPSTCQREDKVLNGVAWAAVVADEAHRGKSPAAQQTRALWALGDRAGRRIALTGTPVANSPEDLWSIMRFVSPDEWPAKWAWVERYAQTIPNVFSGGVDVIGIREDRRAELERFLLPRFIRRTKAEVLPDLPPKVYERREVTLKGKQRKAYDEMESEMLANIDGGVLVAANILTASLRLRQLASAYGEVVSAVNYSGLSYEDPEQMFTSIDSQVRLAEPSSKLDALEEVLEELGNRQAVIFAESRQLIELAAARLVAKAPGSVAMITGAIGPNERTVNIEAFQRGEAKYILATLAAGGEGITLTAADTAIFLQRSWSSVLDKQAEDRLHRIGQEAQSVTYIDLVTADTIEERVFEALRTKAARLEDVVQDARRRQA